MSSFVRRTAITGAACLLTSPLLAHPGHGTDGGSHEMTHYLTEPVHVAPLVVAALVGVVAAGVVAWYRRNA